MADQLQIRIHGDPAKPTLIYFPGLHGDWTLIGGFRRALADQVRFIDFTYPRTTQWTLSDYANGVWEKLAENNVTEGWLLGESFGSQIVWALLSNLTGSSAATLPNLTFQPRGVILAGGFVRYPLPLILPFVEAVLRHLPTGLVRLGFASYAFFARIGQWRSPESRQSLREFVARRTREDLLAMAHRIRLLRQSDPGEIATNVTVPVWQLAGLFDPVVCACSVRSWLRQNCPSHLRTRIIWWADHNVLSTASSEAGRQVLDWICR